MQNATTGITYLKTGDRHRAIVNDYHRKPYPREMQKTMFNVDIAGLKMADRRNVHLVGAEFVSKFTIGMEVEKNRLSRGAVKEYELFCGFERDSSCGYEAVTNILPLLPAGMWRNKVFDMMFKASRIIEDQYSPSNDRCGGHISIGVRGMTGDTIMGVIRPFCGILYAIFHKRLNTHFCEHNPRMLHRNDADFYNYPTHSKYNVAQPKTECLEFRLPSRFQSVKQMMRRYELMYEITNFAFNTPRGSHKMLLKKVKPILMSMYDGNEEKVNERIKMAEDFREYILNGTITDLIRPYVRDRYRR